MKAKYYIQLITIFSIFFILSNSIFAVDISDEECLRCHIMKNPLLPFEENKLIEFKEEYTALDFGVADDLMCYSCHDGSVDDSRYVTWNGQRHKIDIKPTPEIKVPQGFPLKEGKIYCGTCHSPHAIAGKSWLRMLNINSSMCRECHRTKVGDATVGNHPTNVLVSKKPDVLLTSGAKFGLDEQGRDIIICQTCHVIHGSTPGERLLVRKNEGEGIGNSVLCEICHTDNPSKPDRGAGVETHTVNIRPKKAIIPLFWEGDVPAVVSYNGNIVCRTCHVPHRAKSKQALLPETNEIGQFCSRCHPTQYGKGKAKDNIGTHPLGLKLTEGMEIEPQSRIKLFEGKIICGSCHIAHNAFNTGSDAKEEEIFGLMEMKKMEHFDSAKIDITAVHDTTNVKKSIWDSSSRFDTSIVKIITKFSKKYLLVYSNKNDRLCEKCHTNKVTRSLKEAETKGIHPVNIASTKVNIPRIIMKKGGRLGILKDKPVIICSTCHRIHGGEAGTSNLIITDADARICGYCHSGVNVASLSEAAIFSTHPVNVPSRKLEIPEKIFKSGGKVGLKGEIICYTCHSVHKSREGTMMLVLENIESSDICVVCHPKQKMIENTEHNLMIIAPQEQNIKGLRIREAGVCGGCHLAHGGKGAKVWAKNVPPVKAGEDPVGKLCLSCHIKGQVGEKKQVGEFTHPTNFDIERVTGETDLPLFRGEGIRVDDEFIMLDGKKVVDKSKRKGKVMCATCHDVHQWDPTDEKSGSRVNTEGDGRNSFLRKRNIENFLCKECHQGETTIIGTDHDLNISGRGAKNIQGKTVIEDGTCSACHLMHNGKAVKIWAREIPDEVKKEDNIGRLCKSCHLKGQMAEKKPIIGKYSHPTGVNIKRADGTSKYPLYDSAGKRYFNKNLLEALKTGKDVDKYYNTSGLVTCGTCHSVHLWNYLDKNDRPNSNVEGTGLNSFLRGTKDNTSSFCKECHEDKMKIERSEHDMSVVEQFTGQKNIINLQGKNVREDGVCSGCHVIHNGNGPFMWARDRIPDGDSIMTLICVLGCHERGKMGEKELIGQHSHPCDTPITDWRVNPTLPLYANGHRNQDGFVTCSTCHNTHMWDPVSKDFGLGKNVKGTAMNSFLRIANDRKSPLCGNCHFENVLITGTKHDFNLSAPKEKNVKGEVVSESGPCGVCHSTHNALEVKLWARVPGKSDNDKDLITALCKSCHAKGQISAKKEIIGFNHPINITQIEAGLPTSLPLYDDMGKKKIDGKMTCGTCHDPHRWAPSIDKGGPGKITEGDGTNSFLRLDNRKLSALCVDCHQREGLIVNTDHDLSVTVPDEENLVKETVWMSGVCSPCHLMHNANDIRRWSKPLGEGEDYITQLCHSCHADGKCAASKVGKYTHSIGVKMQKGRSTTLPLYTKEGKRDNKNGVITCITCHFSHQWSPNQYRRNVLSKGLFSFENIKDKVVGYVGYPSGSFVYIDTIDSYKPEIGMQFVIFKKGKIIARCVIDKVNPFSKNMEVFAKIIEYDPDEKIEKGNYVVEKSRLAKGIEGNGRTSFLRKANDSSTSLCFDCHTEKETVLGTDHDMRLTANAEKNMMGDTVYDGGICSACHRSHQGASLYIASKEVPADPKGLIYSPVCFGCHRNGGSAENKNLGVHHKIVTFPTDEEVKAYIAKNGQVKPEMRLQMPDKKYNLPLYTEDGEIDQGDGYKKKVVTCSTCHNEHVWDPTNPIEKHEWDSTSNFYVKKAEGDAKNSFLRVRNDNYQLCGACHLETVHLAKEEMLMALGKNIKNIESAQKNLEEQKKKDAVNEVERKKKFDEEEAKEMLGKVGKVLSVSKDFESDDYVALVRLFGKSVLNNKDPGKYMISLNDKFEGSNWIDYAQEVRFSIPLDVKKNQIFVKYQDKMGNLSLPSSIDIPPVIISISPQEEKSKLPNLIIKMNILRAKYFKMGEDKYLEKDKWNNFDSTVTFVFPQDSPMDQFYVQFKDDNENKSEVRKIFTPEDLIKPRIRRYEYHEPLKITNEFKLSLVFSETLNQNIQPRVKITNMDAGGVSPKVPEIGMFFSTHQENDTYILEDIKLTKEMGGRWLISVESAEGVVRNVMDPVSDKIVFFDTRDKTLDFYNSIKFKIKEGNKTKAPNITLLMEGKGAEQMMVSENDPNFENSIWELFKPVKEFMLVPVAGVKTINVKFRNDEKLVSDVLTETIVFTKSSAVDVLSGSITEDNVYTKEGSPYYIVGKLTIERGVNILVEPGVKFLFSDYIKNNKLVSKGMLVIKGNIIAKGTKEDNIIFTAKNDNPEIGAWDRIKIDRNMSENKNVFEFCTINYSNYGLWVEGDNPIIKNCTFENINNDAIHFERDCQGLIINNTIKNNGGSGIFLRECSPEILKNTLENNKEGISCFAASLPKISDNYINNNEIGISMEEMSAPRITNVIVENNKVGIKIMSYCYPTIANSNIQENKEFGIFVSESCPMIYRNIIQKNKIGVFAEKDYRDFKLFYNNIRDNTQYNLKIWDWWRDFLAMENYWGADNKYEIKNKIYDKENYDKEPKKEDLELKDDMPQFDFLSETEVKMDKLKAGSKELVYKEKVFGIVRYSPFSFSEIKGIGIK